MGTSTSSSSYFLPRFLFRALLVVGLVCLLVVGSLGGRSDEGTRKPTTQGLKHGQVVGRDKATNYEELDFNYMSKRRVPNGPDPIHNRRAGNSGRPPGQA